MITTEEQVLTWEVVSMLTTDCVMSWEEATLGTWPDDGVRFSIAHQPSNYRRGPFKLLIEMCLGSNHYKWGCFDFQDQPIRYFHKLENLKSEAELIARVLLKDRAKK